METLKWGAFVGDRAVRSAYQQLKSLSSRTIALHSLSLLPGIPEPFFSPSRDKIHVFIDETSPLVSHSIVHELIHGILMEEGYHRLTGASFDPYIRGVLSNELQHPEVFRRMEGYGLEMAPYWDGWGSKLRRAFDDMKTGCVGRHPGFVDFPQVFTWFFFPQASAPYLMQFSEFNQGIYEAARAAFEDTRFVGFETMETHRHCLEIFKTHWLCYCELHLPKDEFGQGNIKAIKDSISKPVSEIASSFTDEKIMAYLKERGRATFRARV